MGIEDYFEQAAAKQADLAERIYCDGKTIFIRIGVTSILKSVPVNQVKTPEGLLRWTYELARHSWMDSDRLRRFIEVAGEAGGVKFQE
ncbi:hypothetical protein AWB74_08104 [Caballeronia arvi]|uniref:Uncharacterized protein n=1 Tax=Caballeronia arvi TaxID=1777135 RepID=A0A158L372_9BURK|nr:hypothetical protein [Caballeronia arvi]SAL87413.1 hypothetical protein AWB74_08104 [Caballeronia arvi]